MRDFIKWFLLWIQETNVQPKELYVWEEIETSHDNYFSGMTVKKMQHHEP